MQSYIKAIAFVILTIIIVLLYIGNSDAGGPWHDQYCDVETTQIRVIDTQGNVIDERIEELLTTVKYLLGLCL
jgi:hypothetical protein